MNLFLLTAVPLAAVAIHLFLYADRPAFERPSSWLLGVAWSLGALVVAALFGKWREFNGDLTGAFLGLTFTDVLLVPGAVVAAWLVFRRSQGVWELGLWLALVGTLAGVRDVAATSRIYDLNELFLVPLDRILVLVAAPTVVAWALESVSLQDRLLRWGTLGLVLLGGSVVPLLSFAHWGWVSWVATLGGIVLTLWLLKAKKKAVPEETA